MLERRFVDNDEIIKFYIKVLLYSIEVLVDRGKFRV